MAQQPVETTVKEEDINLEDYFGGFVGNENITQPSGLPDNEGMLNDDDTSDEAFNSYAPSKPTSTTTAAPATTPTTTTAPEATEEELERAFANDIEVGTVEGEQQGNKKPKPTASRDAIVDFLSEEITAGNMMVFDDFDESKQDLKTYLSNLSAKDIKSLFKTNEEQRLLALQEEMPQKIYESLPPELQSAFKYVADGGKDIKSMFRALAEVEGVKSLEVGTDDEKIVYEFLTASQFGDSDQVKAQIQEWKDLNMLDKKSAMFKPKLEQMKEKLVATKLAEEENRKAKQKADAQHYYDSVQKALNVNDLSGVPLNKKTQAALYHGLTSFQYPSLSGKPTNELGHLLERAQSGETANFGLVAKVLWLLKDEKGFEETLALKGANQNTEDTVRTLKSLQGKGSGVVKDVEIVPTQRNNIRKISKQDNSNFLKP